MTLTFAPRRSWLIGTVIAVGAVALFTLPAPEISPGQRFVSSLRIAKPKPVTATAPGASQPGAGRQVQALVAGLLAESTTVTLDEGDVSVASADSATRVAGFAIRLPGKRTDSPTITVLGAHETRATVNRAQLLTLLGQAGRANAPVPESVNGAVVTLKTPRAIRVQYGNCPAPAANTIQNQVNGPPPPTAENANCVVLTETPVASIVTPAGLDVDLLVEIALQLVGMTPRQTAEFQRQFHSKSTLVMSLPRFIRSFDTVAVNANTGLMFGVGGRRGPTYNLVWVDGGTVFNLTGYGNSADAVPLAQSTH